MAVATFDTHKFIKTLQNAGFEEQKAEALAFAFQSALAEEKVAREIINAKNEKINNNLFKWVVALALAQGLIIGAIIKFI